MLTGRIVLVCLFILMLLSACGGNDVPAPATEAPVAKTEPAPTVTSELPAPTTAPTSTSEPETETDEDKPEATSTQEPVEGPSFDGFLLEGVGFKTPESVMYDAIADVYLVANINGSPGAKDGNGFISRISPEGEVINLKWIDGTAEDIELHAPKGMAITSAGLYIADVDTVRLFDSGTGLPLDVFAVSGATFLNDVTAGEDETIYVSDSGSGAIYQITPDGTVIAVIPAGGVQGPNGVAVWNGTLYVTSGEGIFAVEDGILVETFSVPASSLDGLVFLDEDNILVSSWKASTVYQAGRDGSAVDVVVGVPAPADIGFDSKRGYILIPLFNDNKLDVRPLP